MNTATPPAAAAHDDFDVLFALARRLSSVMTVPDLREMLTTSLRPMLPSRDISILRAAHGKWEALFGPEDGPERIHQYCWTPLVSEGKTIGMLGIGAPVVGGPSGRLAEGVTSLLATAVQNIIVLDNLRQDSVRDSLTGCFNRAHAMEVLEGNLRRASRTGLPVSIMMIDVDDFKTINDGFGHVPGDAVLEAVARELHRMLRQSDIRCRFGGDEFMVVLPDTALEDAMRVAESVRHGIEAIAIPTSRGEIRLTVSIGVASAISGAPVDVAAFIDRADVALYRAKEAGRNCVQACAASSVRARSSGLRLAAKTA